MGEGEHRPLWGEDKDNKWETAREGPAKNYQAIGGHGRQETRHRAADLALAYTAVKHNKNAGWYDDIKEFVNSLKWK